MERCGKLRLVLKNKRYFVESTNLEILSILLKDPIIQTFHCKKETIKFNETTLINFKNEKTKNKKSYKIYSFEIHSQYHEKILEKTQELNLPLLEEYDFKKDLLTENLNIFLKPITKQRPYQQKSLSKMFGNGIILKTEC